MDSQLNPNFPGRVTFKAALAENCGYGLFYTTAFDDRPMWRIRSRGMAKARKIRNLAKIANELAGWIQQQLSE
jgi:hypothetical protein